MQKCWYKLNIDVSNAMNPNLDYVSKFNDPEPFDVCTIHESQILQFFNEEWIDYVNDLGLMVVNGVLFYRKANFDDWTMAHRDTIPDFMVATDRDSRQPVNYALNWVISPTDTHDMVWYNHPDPGIVSGREVTENGFTEIDRRCIGHQMTLVNSGAFHTVSGGNTDRYCISLRSVIPGKSIFCSWEEAVDYFKELNLISE